MANCLDETNLTNWPKITSIAGGLDNITGTETLTKDADGTYYTVDSHQCFSPSFLHTGRTSAVLSVQIRHAGTHKKAQHFRVRLVPRLTSAGLHPCPRTVIWR